MKKTKGPTRRTSNPRKRVAQDFRDFKTRLKRWIDKTQLVWEGKPYSEGSVYRFVLDERLVRFILSVAVRAQESQEAQAQAATLKMAEAVRLASMADPDEDGGPSEPTPDTEAAFEKYLTVSGAGGIIEPDEAEAVEVEGAPEPEPEPEPETEPEPEQDPQGSP